MSSEIPKQGLVKQDNNKDDDTKEVEDTDMKDQDDIDDIENHNVNINCKENGIVVEFSEVNKVNVNNNYDIIEFICNDENKSVKDDLNHDNIEERTP